MYFLYNELLHRPLLNLLVIIYNTVAFKSIGLAVIFLTILVRLILFPVFHKITKNQLLIQKIQPEIKTATDRFKHDKEKQVKEVMAIYKKHNLNPLSGFLLLFIQLPVLIALFYLFYNGFTPDSLVGLYSFVLKPDIINSQFLNLINLNEPSIIIVALTALCQYFTSRLSLPKINQNQPETSAGKLNRQMTLIAPILTFVILWSLPAVIGLYWLTTTIFSLGQQSFINRSLSTYGSIKDNFKNPDYSHESK